MKLNQITVPALDLQLATEFYRLLGLRFIVNSSHYMRFVCPEGDSTFSIELVDASPNNSPIVVYFETDNLDLKVGELKDAGLVFTQGCLTH